MRQLFANTIVAGLLLFTATVSVKAQKKRPAQKTAPAATKKAPAAPAKPVPPPGSFEQAPAAGREERELAVPKPTAAKLPEVERQYEDINKNPTRGTFTFTMSAGLYNFNNKTENVAKNTTREYSLQIDATTMLGVELAWRMGHDKENDHDTGNGFHYYRSNRGIFTDFELGFKTQRTEDKPSRFNVRQTVGGVATDLPLDLGYDYTVAAFLGNTVPDAQRLKQAGISPELRQAVGKSAFEGTMVYANTYYHFTPLNMLMNWGSAFRWFDSSIGPSLRVWYYQDYSDPVRITTRDDDWTRATFMIVYRQYVQFHPLVRLRTHFYFPALSFFGEMAKSPYFNEKEYILNTALEFYAMRVNNIGLIVAAGYEGHWWQANPYSSDRFVRTGFVADNGFADQNYSGFEHRTRTSWEAFATIGVELHFDGKS
jgi:hypothetical protein